MNSKKLITLSIFIVGVILLFIGIFHFVNLHVTSAYNLRLLNSVNNAQIIIPPSFVDSAAKNKPLNQLAYDSIRQQLNRIAEINEVEYIYILIQKNNQFQFVISTFTEEDVKNNLVSDYLSVYEDAPAAVETAISLEPREYIYDDYNDKWGSFHSIFYTQKSSQGVKYVVGADFKTRNLLNIKWMTSIIILGVTAILILLIFPLAFAFARERKK